MLSNRAELAPGALAAWEEAAQILRMSGRGSLPFTENSPNRLTGVTRLPDVSPVGAGVREYVSSMSPPRTGVSRPALSEAPCGFFFPSVPNAPRAEILPQGHRRLAGRVLP